jgi:hypothetical protein
MQRIQYHRYGGPEEKRLETDELPALGEYVHDRAPFPRAIGTDFSGVLESIDSTEGRVHPHGAYVLAKETSPSTDADVLGFSSIIRPA